jgi:hypothetical protein
MDMLHEDLQARMCNSLNTYHSPKCSENKLQRIFYHTVSYMHITILNVIFMFLL